MDENFKTDASWIRRTLRSKSIKDYKDKELRKNRSKTLTRAKEANRRATLMGKKEDVEKKRLESKNQLAEMKIPSENDKDNTGKVEKDEVEGSDEEYSSEYDYETESESEEEDDTELNEMNFNKLLNLRVQTTDFQLDAFCAKYIFVLEKEGVKIVHNLADEFENLCKEIYEPMLLKASPKRKGTLRRKTQHQIERLPSVVKPQVKIPSELPTQHARVQKFFEANDIIFDTVEIKEKFYEGMHVGDSCCFLQFLILKFREMIIHQHLQRWTKKKEEIIKKNQGALVLEEYFMPPMNVEPKLDEELVKFSNLMANRQYEISQFQKKMIKKDPKSVAFNILKTELKKYVQELEEKINVSEIYFAAAIMRVKQKQQNELEKIYDAIEAEDNVDEEVESNSGSVDAGAVNAEESNSSGDEEYDEYETESENDSESDKE